VQLGDGTSRTLTFNGNGDMILNGFFIASTATADHILAKSGQGVLFMNGSNTTGGTKNTNIGGFR